MEDFSRTSRSRRRSRSRRHSEHRSRSHSPRESLAAGNNSQDNHLKQPQFIPIPVPYYQPPMQPQASSSQPPPQSLNIPSTSNNNNQPMTYVLQPSKQQQLMDEFVQSPVRPSISLLAMHYFGNISREKQ